MSTKFHAPHPWSEIKKNATNKKCWIAVPFIGKNAASFLPIRNGSVLITRCNEQSVSNGQVDPNEILKFIRRGVKVHNYGNLHAKVYVLGNKVFVGSVNVSKTSQSLSEACIETNDLSAIKDAKEYIESLSSDLMTVEYVKSLIKLYPKEIHWSFDGTKSKGSKTNDNSRSKVWVSSVEEMDYSDEVKKVDKFASKVASSYISNPNLYKLSSSLSNIKPPFQVSDINIYRYKKGRGFEFECPTRVIDIVFVPATKEYIIYAEQQKRVKKITSSFINSKYKGSKASIFFKSGKDDRLIRSSKDAKEFLQLWSQFRL